MAATIIQRWARKHVIKKDRPQFEDSYEEKVKQGQVIAERQIDSKQDRIDLEQIDVVD